MVVDYSEPAINRDDWDDLTTFTGKGVEFLKQRIEPVCISDDNESSKLLIGLTRFKRRRFENLRHSFGLDFKPFR